MTQALYNLSDNERASRIAKPKEEKEKAIHSIQAEEGLVSGLMNEPSMILKMRKELPASDFVFEKPQLCYKVIQTIIAENPSIKEIDIVSMIEKLKALGRFGGEAEQIDASYILKLKNYPESSPQQAVAYADMIRDYALRRRGAELGQKFSERFLDFKEKPEILVDLMLNEGMGLQNWYDNNGRDSHFRSHETCSETYLERLEGGKKLFDLFDNDEEGGTVQKILPIFGLPRIDGIDGTTEPALLMIPSSLTTILSDTSGGKTILANQIAMENAKRGLNTLVFINELSIDIMEHRRMASITGISVNRIIKHNATKRELSIGERGAIQEAETEIKNWPGKIDYVEASTWSGDKIFQEAVSRNERKKIMTGAGYALVIVDYVQLIGSNSNKGNSNTAETITDNMISLNNIATKLDTAVIVTSQVTRDSGASRDKRVKPGLHSAYGSDFIVKKSNNVIGLTLNEEKTQADFEILKCSFGESGRTIVLNFSGQRYFFY